MVYQTTRQISAGVASASVIRANRFVAWSTTTGDVGIVEEANNAGDLIAGIAVDASANGETRAISIITLDGSLAEVEAGEAITVGDDVGVRTDGRAGPYSSGSRVGVATEAAAAAGEIITIQTRFA